MGSERGLSHGKNTDSRVTENRIWRNIGT